MKPIKLVIKGLNSFIEEQTIDFNKLTDRGLFGIFGPTGSGKSTILDGITLALYGDIARKSSNYINTNCNDLNVSFTFQISGSPNRIYVVSRHFKRDKKTGNAKTHSAMVKEITDDNEEILAESKTTVDKVCKEILGLSLEDFTRTVVLPQGKFSEFLKLEGKHRRDMLERLFNLQDYGEKLSIKLSKEINIQRDEANKIAGEMNSFDDISEEKLTAEKQNLAVLTKELETAKKKQEEVDERYKKGEEIWNLQSELANYKERQKQLDAQTEEIEQHSQRVKQGESAAKVYPFLQGYEKTREDLEKTQDERVSLETKQKELAIKKESIEEIYAKANKEKEEQLPQLKDKQTQLQEAITQTETLINNEILMVKVQSGLKKVINDIDEATVNERSLSEQIEKINQEIQETQEKEQSFKVEEKLRLQTQEGVKLTGICSLDQKNLDKNLNVQSETLKIRQVLEVEHKKLNATLEEKKVELQNQIDAQKKHNDNVPITREALLKEQEQLATLREKYTRLQKLREEIVIHHTELDKIVAQKQELSQEFDVKSTALESLKRELEKAKIENLAHTLRAQLQEGESCPVCGSKSHHLEELKVIDTAHLEELEIKVKETERLYREIETSLKEIQVNEGTKQAQLSRLQEESIPLENLFKDRSIEEQENRINIQSDALTQYENQKEILEKTISSLREEQFGLESKVQQKQIQLEENQKQLSKLADEIALQRKQLATTYETLNQLKQEVGTQDFESMSQEILEKDRKREEISATIKIKIVKKEEIAKDKEEITKFLNERKIKLGSGITKFDETQKQKQGLLDSIGNRLYTVLSVQEDMKLEIRQSIKQVKAFLQQEELLRDMLKANIKYESVVESADNNSLEKENQRLTVEILEKWMAAYPVLGECIHEMKKAFSTLSSMLNEVAVIIENNFIESSKQKEEITNQYETANKQLLEVQTKHEELIRRLQLDKDNLEKQLREEDLTVEEVKLYLMPKETLELLKKNISEYQDEKARLMGSIETIQGKLGNESLEETEWNNLQEERMQSLAQSQEITKRHITLEGIVKRIEEALTKLGELAKKKQKIEHRMAILSDLEKLFKGKRFVEYVAIERLKYISMEASKKLREITNGIYGLEVDDDGRFIIRDYKNGGAQRDASTLSGGETFLASLALALALSAEIQLKGTAPLELFFLDEGFGTLDDDLLEVVMSALEKIHHDKLKVGIISHVEAIKNRVPVKLTLTPAEAGRGGTKVKLERS
ncbi:MAG: AAA family ATPase [Cellulosilyticum sp.]|nr:AAA family ATPase [Cellulosilyticum sp.]